MICNHSSDVEVIKTIVRYCPDWRCQREQEIEDGTFAAAAVKDHVLRNRQADRIRSLEAALLEACDGWEREVTSDPVDGIPVEIAQLRALAAGKEEV